jgi:RNA polymerase sigma-70 factor (ECF subfamily)
MTDAELIAKVMRRDRRAFDLFYDRYAQIIFNLCTRILKDENEAEDVMQEIFVQIWKDADRFDASRASVKTWLFTIARSRALDRYRSRKVSHQRVSDQSEEELPQLSSGQDLQQTNVMQQYVITVLRQLSREQRLVLELSYYEGLTQEEIAERLGEPLGTVKSRIRSALQKLRGLFAGEKTND